MASKEQEPANVKNESQDDGMETKNFSINLVTKNGVHFAKEDLDNLQKKTRCEHVKISGHKIGFQMNDESMGKRWVTRTIWEDDGGNESGTSISPTTFQSRKPTKAVVPNES